MKVQAIGYPSWDDLRDCVGECLSRSIDDNGAQTSCTRMLHFLKFIKRYGLTDTYLTNDVVHTDTIMASYVVFLHNGFSVKNIKIGYHI